MVGVPPARTRPDRRVRWVAWLALVTLGVGLGWSNSASVADSGAIREPLAPLRILSGWVPYWVGPDGPASIVAMSGLASSVSPFSFDVTDAARIVPNGSATLFRQMRQASVGARLPLVPTAADATGARHMAAILADPLTRGIHINALVNVVLSDHYDGIDLDYEDFAFGDGSATWARTKPVWTEFIKELAASLHRYAKLLFVTVPPTYDNREQAGSGYWVYNLPGIAPYVDRLRIMAYGYSDAAGTANAPLAWTQAIVDYVAASLPVAKVELGVPLYGRDWVTGVQGTCPAGVQASGASVLSTTHAVGLARAEGVVPERQANGEMQFTYQISAAGRAPQGPPTPPDAPPTSSDTGAPSAVADVTTTTTPALVHCSVTHLVVYPDAGSSVAKARQALAKGLAGIAMFALGYQEPAHFAALATTAAHIAHARGVDPMGRFQLGAIGQDRYEVRGWALDPETSLPIIVRVTFDGHLVAEVLANGLRPELGALYPGNGPYHGTDLILTASPGTHRVCVQAIGVGLGTTLRWLTCRSLGITNGAPVGLGDEATGP